MSNDDKHSGQDRRTEAVSVGTRQTAWQRFAGLKDEVDVTSALFQQLTTLQWRLQMALADPDKLPDPRGMKELTTALNNLIRSSSLRDGILKAERARQSERLEEAVEVREIMGFGI